MPDKKLFNTASSLAESAHTGQRYGNKPYVSHLADVVNTLIMFNFTEDEDLLASGWLHDALEDTDLERQHILDVCGPRVLQLVHAVTTDDGKTRKIRYQHVYEKINATPMAVVLKLADRIANVDNCWDTRDRRLFMYHAEYSGFRGALYCSDRCEERILKMWTHLDKLMGWRP